MSAKLHRSKDFRLAQVFCGALIVFSLLILGGYWTNRIGAAAALEDATLNEAELRAVGLTASVSELTRGTLYNLDLALLHLSNRFGETGSLDARHIDDVMNSTPPGLIRRVSLIDRNGRSVLTHPATGQSFQVSDREYFSTHLADLRGLYVGAPLRSRYDNEWVIPLSRGLRDRRDNFAGVISIMVSPHYFAEIYGRLATGRDDVVALVLQDGTFVSRSLHLDDHLGKSVRSDRPFVGPRAPESGTFRSFSSHEPVDRVFAFRRLKEWPLVTVIGLGVSESLAPVRASSRRDFQSATAISVLVVLLVAGICVVVMRLELSLVRVRESNERRAMAIAGAAELAWEWDIAERRLKFFGNCQPFFGLAGDEHKLSIDDWMLLVHSDDRESLLAQTTDFLRAAGPALELRFRLRFTSGQYRWVLVRGQKVAFDAAGRLLRALGILMDVDTDRRAQIEATQTREAYRRLIASVGEGIFVVDEAAAIQLFNPAAERLLGWDAGEVIGQHAHVLQHCAGSGDAATPQAGDPDCPVLDTLQTGEARRAIRRSYRHKVGYPVPVEVSVAPLTVEGRISGAVIVLTDVSQRLSYEAELERLARTDGLTGLWNRRYFVELCGRELHRADRGASPLTLLMIDIDHFKRVNDDYGHATGDRVLIALSCRFRNELRMIDIIGRLGGEEFGVCLPGVGLAEALVVAERLRAGLERLDIAAGDACIRCTVSIGLAQWSGAESAESAETYEALLARADNALYAAKRSGRNRVVVGEPA